MGEERTATKRFITITAPQTPDEGERLRTLLRLALAAAKEIHEQEGTRQEANHDELPRIHPALTPSSAFEEVSDGPGREPGEGTTQGEQG